MLFFGDDNASGGEDGGDVGDDGADGCDAGSAAPLSALAGVRTAVAVVVAAAAATAGSSLFLPLRVVFDVTARLSDWTASNTARISFKSSFALSL